MKAFFTALSVLFVIIVSIVIAMYGDIADASYLIQVEILIVLLQNECNKKEGKI